MQQIAPIYWFAANIFSTSYSDFLDSFRIVYTQVTDCLYDTFMTSIRSPGFN